MTSGFRHIVVHYNPYLGMIMVRNWLHNRQNSPGHHPIYFPVTFVGEEKGIPIL